MRSVPYRLLQGLLWIVCLSHLVIGVGVMLSTDFQRTMAKAYGAEVDWTPQFVYIVRPLAAYMLTLGIVGVATALDPLRYKIVIYAFSILMIVRFGQRLIFFQDVQEAFQIDPRWYFTAGGTFLAIGIGLLVLLRLASEPPADRAAVAAARTLV